MMSLLPDISAVVVLKRSFSMSELMDRSFSI